MKYALVCPNEPVTGGYRIAQVEAETFPVGEPTYWLECSDDVVANVWYFDHDLQSPQLVPVPSQLQGLQSV
jgi:hypothetical protein